MTHIPADEFESRIIMRFDMLAELDWAIGEIQKMRAIPQEILVTIDPATPVGDKTVVTDWENGRIAWFIENLPDRIADQLREEARQDRIWQAVVDIARGT